MTQPPTHQPPTQPPPPNSPPNLPPPPPSSPPVHQPSQQSVPQPVQQPPAPVQAPTSGPPVADPNVGHLVLTLQGSMMTSSLIPPTVRLNGYPVTTRYGQNVIPLPPGRWHIDVHCDWLKQFGQAALDVDLAPGQHVPVFYAAPMHQFATGSIGFEKQKRKGVAVFAGIMTALALFVALMILVVFL